MNCRLGGPLGYYVLVLVLLGVQWRPGFSFPTTTKSSCDHVIEKIMDLTRLLKLEAKNLHDEYVKFHKFSHAEMDDVPNSTISGNTIPEKLQDIYIKAVLFEMHMSKVKEYQRQHSLEDETLDGLLENVRRRLENILQRLEVLFGNTDPKIPLPNKPDPPNPSHGDDFQKKAYGLGVIIRLKEWAGALQSLNAGEVCNMNHEGRP